MAQGVDLTKTPGDDKIDRLMDICPTIPDRAALFEILSAAQHDYMSGKAVGPRELAAKYPMLPLEACRRLVTAFGWRAERASRLEDVRIAADMVYAEIIRERRGAEVGSILDSLGPTVKMLSDEIKSILGPPAEGQVRDDKYRTIDARRLAEALAQLSGVLLQAVAADGKMPELPESMAQKAGDGKRPWVNITASGPVAISGGEGNSAPHDAEPVKQTGEER